MNLKDLRKEHGFKRQKNFAKAIGQNISTVSMWETGRAKPDIVIASQIAEVLNVTTDIVVQSIIESKTKNSPEGELKDIQEKNKK